MQLVLDTTGLRFSVRNGCFHISNDAESRQISPQRITSIHITAAISISSPALMLAVKHGIPVVISDHVQHATLRSAAYTNLPQYRRWQLAFSASPEALAWMRALVAQKAEGQWRNMQQWRTAASDPEAYPALLALARAACDKLAAPAQQDGYSRDALRAAEAVAAQYYWDAVAAILPPAYGFTARRHRPALDMFNAALNYWYGMLYHSVEAAIHATGLDAACGMLHAEDYNTPALCYDLIEPFRPGADAALVALCRDAVLAERHFGEHDGGLWLSREGKRLIIPAFGTWLHEKMELGGRNTQRKNHILQLPAGLLRHIRSLYESEGR